MAATTKLYNGIVIGRSTEHMLQPYTLFFGNSTFFMFHALLTKVTMDIGRFWLLSSLFDLYAIT